MKHPENTLLRSSKVVLTSYKPEHVLKYHDWMRDEEILRLTGSERLSLEEEYAMQQDWENDPQKCTFIILSREKYEDTNSETSSMIGDTNLFISQSQDATNDEEAGTAEIEVMIAENTYRRQGCAKESLRLMMDYAVKNLKITKFFAKIKADNEGSIKLFHSLGYTFQSKSDVFDEVCLVYSSPIDAVKLDNGTTV